MMSEFAIKFESDLEEIGFENGVSIGELGDLLKSLYAVTSARKADNIVLSGVSDNCYQVNFNTSNPLLEARVLKASQNVLERSDVELNQKEITFKKSISKILRAGWHMDVLDGDKNSLLTIPYGFNTKVVEAYYSKKKIEGYITEIGDKELESKGLHVYLSEVDFKIFITAEQHDEMMPYYRKRKVSLKVRLKKSLTSSKILSATLLNFKAKNIKNFPENLETLDLSGLNFLHED